MTERNGKDEKTAILRWPKYSGHQRIFSNTGERTSARAGLRRHTVLTEQEGLGDLMGPDPARSVGLQAVAMLPSQEPGANQPFTASTQAQVWKCIFIGAFSMKSRPLAPSLPGGSGRGGLVEAGPRWRRPWGFRTTGPKLSGESRLRPWTEEAGSRTFPLYLGESCPTRRDYVFRCWGKPG